MNIRQVQEAIEQYGINEWGGGYFSIDRLGQIVCMPTSGGEDASIPLAEVVAKAKKLGVSTPMIIRFPQIIKGQLEKMYKAFATSIQEFNYKGEHLGVFPFKVNQRREFIDAVVSCGKDLNWGLEVGSKTEFMAALSYPMAKKALLICNGFKDAEFIDMAFIAQAMGRNVVLVIEGPDELQLIHDRLRSKNVDFTKCPEIGLRIRLYSKGSGKWEKSSGEKSKFGLTTVELMSVLRMITETQLQEKLTMLHFHIGSQITAIKRFKNAIREAARVYAKIVKMGFKPIHLNIGGGVGVDYDGSHTSSHSSANYRLQEFANDAVYIVGDVCKHEQVEHPNIVTESGRVIAAYHSVVVTDIREVQGEEEGILVQEVIPAKNGYNRNIYELQYILESISPKNYVECYHDAVEFHEDLFTLFNLGYINLNERSIAEALFNKICLQALHFSTFQKHQAEEFSSLQKLKVAKYLANFSIFQSIPDAWSIDQLFPVLPLTRHDEKPTCKASIVDITCDSDGCIERFTDRKEEKSVIELHSPNGNPYYIGFFLVGAYQESLANEHNLFGAIHEVEVNLRDGQWEISKTTNGDTIKELLVCRNYEPEEMLQSYHEQFQQVHERGLIEKDEIPNYMSRLENYFQAYPYLIQG